MRHVRGALVQTCARDPDRSRRIRGHIGRPVCGLPAQKISSTSQASAHLQQEVEKRSAAGIPRAHALLSVGSAPREYPIVATMAAGEPGRDATPRARVNKLTSVCPYILVNEFCERLAFHGLTANLVIYLTRIMGLSDGPAAVQVSLFSGTAYITPLIGAWVADGYWGRFKTIMAFSMVYSLGMFGLAATALVPGLSPPAGAAASTFQLTLFFLFLYTVACGTGGIKPNVSAFGADQFDERQPVERAQKETFFNYFYFSINVGAFLSMTVIVWIQGWSWALGFALPALFMAASVAVFYAGRSRYILKAAAGSPFERIAALTLGVLGLRMQVLLGWQSAVDAVERAHADEEMVLVQGQRAAAARDFLQAAGHQLGMRGDQIEEVRMVYRLVPILLLGVLYNAMWSQMDNVFVLQAEHMDRRLSIPFLGTPFLIPEASMRMFDIIAVIALVPVYDGVLKPILKRVRKELSILQRIGWGFLVVAAAMAWSGLVEQQRMAALAAGERISILTQATQYALVGASEVLAAIGLIEFFYDQAPDAMRSGGIALAYLSTSLGGYLSAFVLSLVTRYTSWLNNLDDGSRLDIYFYLLAVVMVLNWVLFVVVTRKWQYKQDLQAVQPDSLTEGLAPSLSKTASDLVHCGVVHRLDSVQLPSA